MILPATVTPFVCGPIVSAGLTPLSESVSGQPILSDVILDWFRNMVVGIVTAQPDTTGEPAKVGTVTEVIREENTSGCLLPGDPEDLDIAPAGARSWQSNLLYTVPSFNVPTDTRLRINGMKYRVMKKRDFSVNGYVKYWLVEGYQNAS